MNLYFYILALIYFVYSAERIYAALTLAYYNESTSGLNILHAKSLSDNTIVMRVARLDFTTGNCNEPKIMFRTVVAGSGTILALDLGDDGNSRIPPYNFCEQTPTPKKRSLYIFDDNHQLDAMRRSFKRTPQVEPKTPPPSPPSTPPKAKAKTAIVDRIKVLAFYKEFVLVYYSCGVQVCGDIYSVKNIKKIVLSVSLTGNCDETNAVQGPDGFLFLCYREIGSSILWETWTANNGPNGVSFNRTYYGTMSNVTIPNKLEAESFTGGLFKVFAIGNSSYSIIMGSYNRKLTPDPKSNIYAPPIELNSYFLTNANIKGPSSIYQNIENIGGSIGFQVQTCHAQYGGGGYKCLVSVRTGGDSPSTTYTSILFSQAGEQLSVSSFTVQHPPEAKTPTTLNLNYGGWCIGLQSSAGIQFTVYNEAGSPKGDWGIPVGKYGKLGGTPNNMMWAIEPFDANPMSWSILFTDNLVNFTGTAN